MSATRANGVIANRIRPGLKLSNGRSTVAVAAPKTQLAVMG